jgi:hypothetical protein
VFCFLSVVGAVATQAAPPSNLPADLVAVRGQIVSICQSNTLRVDNINQVQSQIEPLIARLASWYNTNRPANEVQMTQRSWKSIWYQNAVIDENSYGAVGRVAYGIDRDAVYQVVRDGYYYNVTGSLVSSPRGSAALQSFLKGDYTLGNVATYANAGQPKLNVVNLKFVASRAKWGALTNGLDLNQLVAGVENKTVCTYRVPGPIGITGELWNVYLDQDIRIARGTQPNAPDSIYVLLQTDKVGSVNLPAAR